MNISVNIQTCASADPSRQAEGRGLQPQEEAPVMSADRTGSGGGGPLVNVAAVEAQPALALAAGEKLVLLQQVRQGTEPVSMGLFNSGN